MNSFSLPLTCCFSSPLIHYMTVAKMSVYKRMKLACCFDCGRSERDCSCMAGSVHSNMDSLQRAFPLSSVSVHDCSTSLRACKFDRQPHVLSCLWPVYVSVKYFMSCTFFVYFINLFYFVLCPHCFPSRGFFGCFLSLSVVLYGWVWFLYSGHVVVVMLWLLCDSAAKVGGRRVVACCVSGALVRC